MERSAQRPCRKADGRHKAQDGLTSTIVPARDIGPPVGGEEPRLARALPTQDGHLVSQSDELELQRGAAANPEREQGTDSGQKCDHAHDGMAAAQETLHLHGVFAF